MLSFHSCGNRDLEILNVVQPVVVELLEHEALTFVTSVLSIVPQFYFKVFHGEGTFTAFVVDI